MGKEENSEPKQDNLQEKKLVKKRENKRNQAKRHRERQKITTEN